MQLLSPKQGGPLCVWQSSAYRCRAEDFGNPEVCRSVLCGIAPYLVGVLWTTLTSSRTRCQPSPSSHLLSLANTDKLIQL